MPKGFDNLLTILFASVVLVGLVLHLPTEAGPVDHAPARAVAIVHKAQHLIEDNELVSALRKFDGESDFNSGGIYLFVLDADGQNIYHATDHTLVGSDFTKLVDLDRRPFGQNLITDTAKSGVWHSYRTRIGWRLTYARKIRGGQIIAAGLTAPNQPTH